MSITQAQYEQMKARIAGDRGSPEPEKQQKYKNKKVVFDGIKFDSTKEGKRYLVLKWMLGEGLISDLKLQPLFKLSVCNYQADFSYILDGKYIVEDCKSPATRKQRAYRIKNKMMLHELNIKITET